MTIHSLLIHYLVTTNSETFDDLKQKIKDITPQQYPGQNIKTMAGDYLKHAETLTNGGYFETSLILNMVDGFLCASKDEKGTFHFTMNGIRKQVADLQQRTIFMTKQDQLDEYSKAMLSPTDVCLEAVKEYTALDNKNKWEPSKLPKDRHTPASQNANLAAINTLIASLSDRQHGTNNSSTSTTTNSSRRCYNCGDPNHMAKECPHPKKSVED